MLELRYPLFDGEKVIDNAVVAIEDGIITAVRGCENADSKYLLMPGLIDAHTHMGTMEQVQTMLRNGVTATCDVSASASLVKNAQSFTIIPSAGMAMGVVLNPKDYVEKAVANGAAYIKVLLFNTLSIGKGALRGIVKAAHEKGLRVAVHATEVSTVRQSVDCGADILLHVPMKEKFPVTLAEEIAKKNIVVAPTLVMMETFAGSGRNGYKPEHYKNAEQAVRLLRDKGVTILAATDANIGSFAPAVSYGSSMHRELELLVKAGLTPVEALASATNKVAQVFGIPDLGEVAIGKRAVLVLAEGRPDNDITQSANIKEVWVNGKPILGGSL